MADYHWKICTDQDGTELFTFTVNPLDISGVFPERTYTAIPIIAGPTILQFPEYDTRLRRIKFDLVPEENTTHMEFLLGTSESDSSSLLYLDALDSDGQLTPYWLHIPETYKNWRPRGYRDTGYIPIRVEEVHPVPEGGGLKRWQCEMLFRIIPKPQAEEYFVVGESQLDGANYLIASELDAVYFFDDNLASYTDETTDAQTDSQIFPAVAMVQNDMLYFGSLYPFHGLEFVLDTNETISPDPEQGFTEHVWEYFASDNTWTALSETDSTVAFTKDSATSWGICVWSPVSLSAAVVGGPATTEYYWVRVTLGSLTTAPVFDTVYKC